MLLLLLLLLLRFGVTDGVMSLALGFFLRR
jgi:hypothetical protein